MTEVATQQDAQVPQEEDGHHTLQKLLRHVPATQAAIRDLPFSLLEKSEIELLKKPTSLERKLKISFWNEYHSSKRLNRDFMNLSNVLNGVCSRTQWDAIIKAKPNVLAWIITPPPSEILVWQELLQMGQKKLRKTLSLPLVEKRFWKDKGGEVHIEERINVGLIKEVRAIVENIENRLHGSVVQRAETKSLNVNVNPEAPPTVSVEKEMEEIKKLLTKIEKASRLLPENPPSDVVIEGDISTDVSEDFHMFTPPPELEEP
jgi:hypothetical protein